MEEPSSGAETRRELTIICRSLRAKTGYGTTEGGDEPWLLLDTSTTNFRCLRTMEAHGPDDYFAEPYSCREGRSCYAPPANR